MKKEVLIAIIIGFCLGLVITFGIWSANKALKKQVPEETPQISLTETPTPTPTNEFSLVITSPEENSISDQETIDLKGQTSPKAIIVVLYQEGEKILEADTQGLFSTEVKLVVGANEIKIKAFDQNGNQVEKIMTVVYSTAEI